MTRCRVRGGTRPKCPEPIGRRRIAGAAAGDILLALTATEQEERDAPLTECCRCRRSGPDRVAGGRADRRHYDGVDQRTSGRERGAGAEVRPVGGQGAGPPRDVQEPPARRHHPAVVQRLQQLRGDGRRDDAGVGLRLPADGRRADLRRADQPRRVRTVPFCNQGGVPPGVERRTSPNLREVTSKAAIIQALKESVAYCDAILAAASEAWLQEAKGLGGSSSGLIEGMRAHAFMYNNVTWRRTTAPSRPTCACRAWCLRRQPRIRRRRRAEGRRASQPRHREPPRTEHSNPSTANRRLKPACLPARGPRTAAVSSTGSRVPRGCPTPS